MPKMLKVTKQDKTVHLTEMANKVTYQHLNNRIHGPAEQWKLEEVDVEVKDGKYLIGGKEAQAFDEGFITASEAQGKISDMQTEIEHLRRQLALKPEGTAGNNGSLMDPASASRPFAAETPITSTISTDEFNKQLKAEAGQGATIPEVETMKAADLIAAIKEAKTEDEVMNLFNGDTRVTVQNAVSHKISELRESA